MTQINPFVQTTQQLEALIEHSLQRTKERAMYRNILIATDGSKLAEEAVSHGVSLPKATGVKVTALTVHWLPIYTSQGEQDPLPLTRTE